MLSLDVLLPPFGSVGEVAVTVALLVTVPFAVGLRRRVTVAVALSASGGVLLQNDIFSTFSATGLDAATAGGTISHNVAATFR